MRKPRLSRPRPSIMLPEEAPQAPISLHQHALALLSDADTGHVLRTALAAEFAATSAAAPSAPAPQAYSTSDEEPASEEVSSNYDRRMWELDKMLALVPPWYLLPLADAVLPENSVRLFHIDTQWLSAFADGMLSIGTHTEVDSGCTPNLKSVLFQTYIEDPPIACGLLMRSPVLRHWPQDPFTTKEDELLFAAHGGANLVGRSQLGRTLSCCSSTRSPTRSLCASRPMCSSSALRREHHRRSSYATPATGR